MSVPIRVNFLKTIYENTSEKANVPTDWKTKRERERHTNLNISKRTFWACVFHENKSTNLPGRPSEAFWRSWWLWLWSQGPVLPNGGLGVLKGLYQLGVTTLVIGIITPLITGRDPPCYTKSIHKPNCKYQSFAFGLGAGFWIYTIQSHRETFWIRNWLLGEWRFAYNRYRFQSWIRKWWTLVEYSQFRANESQRTSQTKNTTSDQILLINSVFSPSLGWFFSEKTNDSSTTQQLCIATRPPIQVGVNLRPRITTSARWPLQVR